MMQSGRNYITKTRSVRLPASSYAIAPTPQEPDRIAQIVCGHDFVQAMDEEQQALFEVFVRDVVRTELK